MILPDISSYVTEKADAAICEFSNYVSTESMLPNRGGITTPSSLPNAGKVTVFKAGDVLLSNIRPYFKKTWLANRDGLCSGDVLVFRKLPDAETTPEFLYALISSDEFISYDIATSKGTKMPRGDKAALMKYEFTTLMPDDQVKVGYFLSLLNRKMSLNTKINDYLAELGVALFNNTCPQTNDPNAVLSDVAEITMGQSPSGSSYNEDGDGEVFYQGRGEFGTYFPRRRLSTTEPKRMAQEGDTLMSVRAPVGDLNVANEKCCIGRGLAAIHSNSAQSFVHYLMYGQARQLDAFNGDGTVFGWLNCKVS